MPVQEKDVDNRLKYLIRNFNSQRISRIVLINKVHMSLSCLTIIKEVKLKLEH